ncbi:Cytosolic phospholipase A2 gamma [Bienertia sinuspersici]
MSKITLSDIQHPLYLHPSDGPTTVVVEKLKGSADYRAWKRSMEISLASKRKLGFVTGVIERDAEDREKQEQWDTCNDMIIAWILNNLEERFSIVNGSRKYKLNTQLYECKQSGMTINEYYTTMKIIWEELDNMRNLPAITELTAVINAFVRALEVEREEHKLFQFLNGDVLETVKEESDSSAIMYGKGTGEGCGVCGKKNHTADKCWRVIGFPRDHPRNRRQLKGKRKENYQTGRWSAVKSEASNKMAANSSQTQSEAGNITMQQLEQMLKNLGSGSSQGEVGTHTLQEDE